MSKHIFPEESNRPTKPSNVDSNRDADLNA